MKPGREHITGLVLAGGRGMRMGGADKGLQALHGEPLAAHVLKRLAPQAGALLISANRHPEAYAALGAPFGATVVADTLPGFPGPLAGLLAGLRAAGSAYVLSAPCDTPGLPDDLGTRLAHALDSSEADIATVTTCDAQGQVSLHPVFALLRTDLADDLSAFLDAGERKVRAWYARHKTVEVAFTDERAFYNINSLQELADLERH
ncbi:molybdenum cofactor guanylyltransferase MobA [Paraburkholderia sp. 22099]|jgi:molybdenum cofactor guanylyltransferase|uniref:Molybdenum cofactor guanylyltransferase n=2 Tax=Burkholderiaceae TaxID=119060 RepID=A0A1M6W2U1_9BURK|nr:MULTISPECIES: molybdenum cofactor guanylyltransferase MobA [Paraburkholderia]AXE93187.1 molybdenum cofactor guanylyltransferase MobA [Paraburkholderia terricola]MDR6445909.1 molybdopterin-guanine dinucleotide biosynthesis protein A [Paraburkholderia terricola]MDR6494719.1 molybdopterin-guanine dinucleotide biosynthesis protein A [Paraburkholderia terricola]SDP14853.1 molybdenum cofactor guanylyltransferase [Paraburkholderia sediminicola]SHK88102.1 molybdenum cofactor guanylyltransferase [Pa